MVRFHSHVLKMNDAFYFALPRLLNRMRGRRADLSESNAVEAYFGSIGIFAVSFLFGLQLFGDRFSGWSSVVFGLTLLFAIWIFWLFVFYINSLIIKVLRACGFLRETPNRCAQDVFIASVVAAMAYRLSILHGWTSWIGILSLLLFGANLVAALFLMRHSGRH